MILPKVGTRPKFLMSQGRGGQGFVHKIDTDGNLEWSQLLSSKVGTFIDSISMSSDGLLNLVCRAESNRENNSVKIGGHSYNSEREGSVYLTTLDKNGLFVSSNHIAKNSRVILRDLLPTDDGIIGVGETEVEFTLGERLISPGEFAGYFQTDGKISFARNVLGGLACAKSGDGHFISIGSNVEKFSADGSTIWTFENSGLSVSSDADGKVYVCGQFYKPGILHLTSEKVAVRRMLT